MLCGQLLLVNLPCSIMQHIFGHCMYGMYKQGTQGLHLHLIIIDFANLRKQIVWKTLMLYWLQFYALGVCKKMIDMSFVETEKLDWIYKQNLKGIDWLWVYAISAKIHIRIFKISSETETCYQKFQNENTNLIIYVFNMKFLHANQMHSFHMYNVTWEVYMISSAIADCLDLVPSFLTNFCQCRIYKMSLRLLYIFSTWSMHIYTWSALCLWH